MPDLETVFTELSELRRHVTSQERETPGLLMRVDRLELILKLQILLVSLGLVWKAVDVFGEFFSQTLKP